MEPILYFSKSCLIILLFIATYQFFLRNDAHFSYNRYFLLAGIGAALFIPFINLHYTVLVDFIDAENEMVLTPVIKGVTETPQVIVEDGLEWNAVLLFMYAAGVLLFLIRLLLDVIKMIQLIYKSKKIQREGVVVCINKNVPMPFTFGKYLFVNDEGFLKSQNEDILLHEKVHLKEKHWVDIFLCESFIIIQWFNPFAWFYGRLIKQNLEFIADRGVLKEGFQLDKYIQQIISETMGAEVSVLANHFRFSQNKRRLKMMKNERKSKWRLLKLLMVLPMLGGLLWGFSKPVYKYRSNPELINDTNIQDGKRMFTIEGKVIVEDTVQYFNNANEMYETKVVGSALPGATITVKGTSRGVVADRDGRFKLEVSEGERLFVSFVGFETKEVKVVKGELLYITMGQEVIELNPRKFYKKNSNPAPIKQSLPNSEESIFVIVEELPSYKDGMDVYYQKLREKVVKVKKKENLNGKVKVQFMVNTFGKIENLKALNRSGEKEAKYAIQFVSELNDWIAGEQRGKPVRCNLIIPVEFD